MIQQTESRSAGLWGSINKINDEWFALWTLSETSYVMEKSLFLGFIEKLKIYLTFNKIII